MPRGTIIRACAERGFCFIQEDNGPEIFALRSEFQNPNISFDDIAGTRVDFSVSATNRGFQARAVTIINDPTGRDYGTIKRLIRNGGFIEGHGAGDRGVFFPVYELLGDNWPEDLKGINVSYTVNTDPKGRLRAVAIRKFSTQGRA
jgi:cold shock CspA family protein